MATNQRPDGPPAITRDGEEVPVIVFFGAKGGVGKTTIARLFGELVSAAPGRDDHHPNVLMIDFDVDHRGLTELMASQVFHQCPTVHEQIATQTVAGADAVDVSGEVSLRSGSPATRGRLYVMPSAPKSATNVFQVIAEIDLDNLLNLLADMIQDEVDRYGISCVIIDCGAVTNPYTAAAAHLATAAFIIGQNERITYQSIETQKSRIHAMYPAFNDGKVRTIINKVRGWETLEQRKLETEIFFDIPFTIDIVDESESVEGVRELHLLLFENFIVELVRKTFEGHHPELIPEKHVLLEDEWVDTLDKAERITEAPNVRRLSLLRHLRPVGAAMFVVGLGLLIYAMGATSPPSEPPPTVANVTESEPTEAQPSSRPEQSNTMTNVSIVLMLAGVLLFGTGWWAARERASICEVAAKVSAEGAEGLFQQLKEAPSARSALDKIRKLARTIPSHD